MRKLFRSRRAVSPVVSAVLMMLVVMIGMSFLFDFFVNYTRDFQVGSGSAVLESMTVEDVWFRDSPKRVEFWIYNLGKVDSTLTMVYVNDRPVQFSVNSIYLDGRQIYPPGNPEIRVGAHANITLSLSWDYSTSYDFKLVTERGSAFEGKYLSPLNQ
jgi:FlaG/FlaF family flagellin (archaellin)